MSLTHNITRTYKDVGQTINNVEAPSANAADQFNQAVPAGAVDQHYNFNLKRAQLVSFSIISDQPVIIGTNGPTQSSPPTNTDKWTLQPGLTYVWTLNQDTLTAAPLQVAAPITADIVTGIYITNLNASSPPVAANVQIKVLLSQ